MRKVCCIVAVSSLVTVMFASSPASAELTETGHLELAYDRGHDKAGGDFVLSVDFAASFDPAAERLDLVAAVETDLPAEYTLSAKEDEAGTVTVTLTDIRDLPHLGFSHKVVLDDHRFSVQYLDADTNHKSEWTSIEGGLLETLDEERWERKNRAWLKAATLLPAADMQQEFGYPYSRYPLHRLAVRILERIAGSPQSLLLAERLDAATRLHSRWIAADAPPFFPGEQESWGLQDAKTRGEPVVDADNYGTYLPPEVRAEQQAQLNRFGLGFGPMSELMYKSVAAGECGSTYRSGSASSIQSSGSFAGVQASVTVSSVSIDAECLSFVGLNGSALGGGVAFGGISTTPTCPSPGATGETTAQIWASADVSPSLFNGCCPNGPPGNDTLTAGTAKLTFGSFNSTISGPTTTGDYTSGFAIVTAVGKACWKKHLGIFTVPLHTSMTGSAQASGFAF